MLRLLKLFCCLLLVLTFVQGQDNPFKPQPLHPGPWVEMTHGEIWPRPKFQQSESKFFVLDAENFKFQVGSTHYTSIYNELKYGKSPVWQDNALFASKTKINIF